MSVRIYFAFGSINRVSAMADAAPIVRFRDRDDDEHGSGTAVAELPRSSPPPQSRLSQTGRPEWASGSEDTNDEAAGSLSRASSASGICSLAPGDSEVEPEVDLDGDTEVTSKRVSNSASGSSAVAEESQPRPRRDTQPQLRTTAGNDARPPLPVDVLNNRPDVGNLGMMFGNWGGRSKDRGMQEAIDVSIKHGPAQLVGLCECEQATQDMLEAPAVAGEPFGAGLKARPGYEFWTVRGNEEKSNLLGIRKIQESCRRCCFGNAMKSASTQLGHGSFTTT